MSEALMGNGGTGNRKVVLWENPNPSNAFSAQSITIDGMSKYKHVYCEFYTAYNNFDIKNISLICDYFCLVIRNVPTATGWRMRSGECSGDTIKFDHGFYYDSNFTSYNNVTLYNTICIPYQIYALV